MLQDAIKTYVAVVWLVIELSTMGGVVSFTLFIYIPGIFVIIKMYDFPIIKSNQILFN